MTANDANESTGTILIVGASRGLGHALAAEFFERGWHVLGTVRGPDRTELHELAEAHPDRVEIEHLDITEPDQIAALHARLSNRNIHILFVNAGTANTNQAETISEVSMEGFE